MSQEIASSAAIHHVMGVANVAKPLDKANAILQKPYDAHKLLATMRNVMLAQA